MFEMNLQSVLLLQEDIIEFGCTISSVLFSSSHVLHVDRENSKAKESP